jgi:hypothetical protein
MLGVYRFSFPKLAVVLYTSGALLHALRVVTGFSPTDIPFFIDWVIAVGAAYAGVGFLLFFREMGPPGRVRRVLSAIMIVHLLGSTGLHVYILIRGSHDVLAVFPIAYSAAAAFGFLGFAWLAGTTHLDGPHRPQGIRAGALLA